MDKNTAIGLLLIVVVIFAFSWLNRPTAEQLAMQQHYQDSIAKIALVEKQKAVQEEYKKQQEELAFSALPDSAKVARLQGNFGNWASVMVGTDGITTLENEVLEIRISNKGGKVTYACLKEYDTFDKKPLVLQDETTSDFNLALVTADNKVLNTQDMYFQPVDVASDKVTMRLNVGPDRYLDFVYSLVPNDYMVNFSVKGTGLNGLLSPSTTSLNLMWAQDIIQKEKGRKLEDRYVGLYYKYVADDVENLNEVKSENKEIQERLKWVGFKDMFFSSVLIAEEGFESSKLDSKVIPAGSIMKQFKMTASVPFDLQGSKSTDMRFYFGPNKFALLRDYDDNAEVDEDYLTLGKLVPLGWGIFRWVNQYFIIPLFDFLSRFVSNAGVIILLLTIIVKVILYPLTRKSYLSSAKMRVLRPQVEEINAKYPGQDQALERQKATMDLYSRAGASPMSGCLPLLLQMPILVALFMFFPSAIELRHESFLWAQDLSTYDAIVSWDAQIPFISSYFGNHISLFCLLMTITNIVYTKYNMEMTNTGQQQMPGMKIMMYLMPVMFLFIFNSYASGLTYYYFLSLLITIVQTLIFRFTINEEKLLAKLEANKLKPQKRSTLMKRLEEMQKAQEEQLRKQQEARQKNKKY